MPFLWDHPGEPVPEENFWTLWCKGRLMEADIPTIWLSTTPSGLTRAHLYHLPIFFTGWMPFLSPNQQHQSTEGNKYRNNNELEMLRWDHSPAVGQTWDVTVPDSYAESYTGSTATKPGAAANNTAQNKIDNYAKLASTHIFYPFAMKRADMWPLN